MAVSVEKNMSPGRRLSVLFPISLDRWRTPISTLLREIALNSPQFDFYSFSNPDTDEDREKSGELWAYDHIHAISTKDVLKRTFDIVHIASVTKKNLLGVKLARWRSFGRTKFIYTANLQMFPETNRYDLFQDAVRQAHDVVSVSKAVHTSVTKVVPSRKEKVIPNGFDAEFFDPNLDLTAELPAGVEPDQPFILWVGVVEDRKRPDILLAAAKRLPEVPFLVAGPAGEEQREDWMGQIEAAPNIHYLGAIDRPRLRGLLSKATALLFPSNYEGLALSLIEAQGMGVPAVVQPVSSMPEIINSLAMGRFAKEDDIDEWVKHLKYYLELSGENKAAMQKELREHALANYQWSQVAAQYRDIYQALTK